MIKPPNETQSIAKSPISNESQPVDGSEPIFSHVDPSNAGKPPLDDFIPEELIKLRAENTDLKDRLLRALAEVENVRHRTARDLENIRKYANTDFARDMVQVADNLGRAIAGIPREPLGDEPVVKPLIEGVRLTERELLRSLERHGVKKINPLGDRFDPSFHEALFEVPNSLVPNGTVVQVVEPGYSIGSRPLRPAKVGVSAAGVRHGGTLNKDIEK